MANLQIFGLATPTIATNGCSLNLDTWYIVLSSLSGVKLLIEGLRYIFVKRNNQESLLIAIGGNYVLMPILAFAFFFFTQSLYERRENVLDEEEFSGVTVAPNECMESDLLSYFMYNCF